MSEIFRPYERLVEITVLGKTLEVPEKNTVLRAFQYISPETIPYGRFCWNQECQYCKITCQLPDDDEARPMLACKFHVVTGMVIIELAPELVWCLRSKLVVSPGSSAGRAAPAIPSSTLAATQED
ncbi:MAG: hypothetical protein GZ088_13755 [Acidipila sp.]|nr:hypothetical protein [Acidipila sp.]